MLKRQSKQTQSKQTNSQLRWAKRSVLFIVGFVALSLLWATSLSGVEIPETRSPSPTPAEINRFLPVPQVHPLPMSLAQRQTIAPPDDYSDHDYFEQIQPTIAGYLVWSRFPVRVYVEPATQMGDRSQEWVTAVNSAIQEWNNYLPLTIVSSPDAADIAIWRRSPPLRVDRSALQRNPQQQADRSAEASRQVEPRARSAETRFTLFVDRSIPGKATLSHRMTIWLGMNQTQGYIRAAARHEFGHALGIWGHSSNPTDVMYFSQVRQPPPISDRDLNTLKRIYQQPTRLGWNIPPAAG